MKKGAIYNFLIWEEGEAQNIYFFKKRNNFYSKRNYEQKIEGKGYKEERQTKRPIGKLRKEG